MTSETSDIPRSQQLADQALRCVERDDRDALSGLLAAEHSADVADAIERIVLPELRTVVYRALPSELAADVLVRLEEPTRADLSEELSDREIAKAVEEMEPDDAADVVAELPAESRQAVLAEVSAEQKADIQGLLQYDEETAGGLMTSRFTALGADLTVAEAIADIRRLADLDEEEEIDCVYVVDADERLVGLVSLKPLLLARSGRRLGEIMESPVQSVPASTDQEEVARDFREYRLTSLPVVDASDRLLGIVTIDDIMWVAEEEETEDFQKLVGAGGDERVDSPVWVSIKGRLPWLKFNLLGAFLGALVISLFEETLMKVGGVAILMHVVANQAGNTGQQALAVSLRSTVLHDPASFRMMRIIGRELLLGLANGVVVGIGAACLAVLVTGQSLAFGVVFGVSMLTAMTIGGTVGAAIPLVLRRLGLDPAQSSSIFLTGITDMGGFAVFLGLAYLLQGLLPAVD